MIEIFDDMELNTFQLWGEMTFINGHSTKQPFWIFLVFFWCSQLHFSVYIRGWSLLNCHKGDTVVITSVELQLCDNRWSYMDDCKKTLFFSLYCAVRNHPGAKALG